MPANFRLSFMKGPLNNLFMQNIPEDRKLPPAENSRTLYEWP